MKKNKDKKLVTGIIILIIGLLIIVGAIFLLKEKPKKENDKEIKETKKHTYKNLTIENTSFDYSDGQMVFKATLHNNSKNDHEFEMALLVIKGKDKKILTEQSIALPEVKAGSSEEITAYYADIIENIEDFEIKSQEEVK